MVKSAIVTGKALLTSTSLAMRGTCNSLIVLGSFSDGLLEKARGVAPCRFSKEAADAKFVMCLDLDVAALPGRFAVAG